MFVKDLNDFAAVNAEYEKFFKENNHPNFPARSCVEVARLPKEVGLEIEAIAVRKIIGKVRLKSADFSTIDFTRARLITIIRS